MKLFFKTLGEGQPLLILHGLFGSSDNWNSHAKEFAKHFKVYLIDLRNHGHSPHSSIFNFDCLADDIVELMAEEKLRDVLLIGHSLGGKVILRLAQSHFFLIEKMIVVDMGLKKYLPQHDQIFEALFAVDIKNCESRKVGEERLSMFIKDESTRQFLIKNMHWKAHEKLAWRFNLVSIFENKNELTKPISSEKIATKTLFIRGEKSNYILDSDIASIDDQVPYATFETIADSGHWVHADAPELFRTAALKFLL